MPHCVTCSFPTHKIDGISNFALLNTKGSGCAKKYRQEKIIQYSWTRQFSGKNFSHQYKWRPVVGMRIGLAQLKHCSLQCFRHGFASAESLVETFHQLGCRAIMDVPQAQQ